MCGPDRPCHYTQFGFGGESAKKFVNPLCNWKWQPTSYILYRHLIAVYQLTWCILVIVEWGTDPHYSPVDTKWKWLIYISDWSYLLLTLYFIFAAVAVTVYHACNCNSSDKDPSIELAERGGGSNQNNFYEPSMPWYLKFMWFLQVTAYSAAVAVTILYWVLEYDPPGDSIHAYGVHVHGVNVVLVLIDLLIVATPYRLLHFIYPSLYSFVYFVFTAIYWAAGGLNPNGNPWIYKGSLDWETDPGLSAIVAALTVVVAAPMLQVLFWLLFKIKEFIFRKCCGNGEFA
ncbi:protein rolling stone-like [Anneissia japonica]|uniref:protein rolling stone-like n=1 Tax=Anneissia japonica TaxID=1529436 RepID=UPI0014256872|nr:protein rolling stone-like [Anneissia japonica]